MTEDAHSASAHPARPLSPHLQIYRWQMSMVTSILHRATGVALSVGSVLLVAWLWAAAYDAEWFMVLHDAMNSPFGRLLLIGWTVAFYYHFCNGIRHLAWDTGRGFAVPTSIRTGWLVLFGTLALSAATWFAACTEMKFGF